MKKIIVLIALLIVNAGILLAQDSIRIYGQVTDFKKQPLKGVLVSVKNKQFKDLYSVKTDDHGHYSMTIAKGNYYCLYAVKPSEYFKTKLEYWTWNLPAYKDMEINPQYERMEIYGINVFEPQVTPHETYMVYFRPMSLTKVLQLSDLKNRKGFEKKAMVNHDTINIAPRVITKDELSISVNNRSAEVVNITKTPVYGRGSYYYGYMIQIKKPKEEVVSDSEYDKISIVLHSNETDEWGRGDCFVEKRK